MACTSPALSMGQSRAVVPARAGPTRLFLVASAALPGSGGLCLPRPPSRGCELPRPGKQLCLCSVCHGAAGLEEAVPAPSSQAGRGFESL